MTPLEVAQQLTCTMTAPPPLEHPLPPLLLEHGQALGAVPLALGLVAQVHAPEVEPLDRAVLVIAAYHLPVRHLHAGVSAAGGGGGGGGGSLKRWRRRRGTWRNRKLR